MKTPRPTGRSSCQERLVSRRSRRVCGKARVGPRGSPLAPARASEARFLLRSRDPVERLARDAVLSEKEAQLGRMFLHVTHGVQLELYIAHRIFTGPGEMEQLVRLLV